MASRLRSAALSLPPRLLGIQLRRPLLAGAKLASGTPSKELDLQCGLDDYGSHSRSLYK